MAQLPTGTACKFSDNDVAVAEKLDVEIDVVNRLSTSALCWARAHHMGTYISRNEDLRHIAWQEVRYLGHGRDLHARAHDDHQIHLILVDILEAVKEVVRQRLTEKGDIRLHDAWLRNVKSTV